MDSPSIDSSHAFSFLIRRTRQITWIHDQKTSWNKQGLVSMSQCFTSPNYQGDIISNRYLFWWCETNPQKGTFTNTWQTQGTASMLAWSVAQASSWGHCPSLASNSFVQVTREIRSLEIWHRGATTFRTKHLWWSHPGKMLYNIIQ